MGNEMTLGDKNNMGKWITDNGTEFVRPRRLTRTEFVRQKGGAVDNGLGQLDSGQKRPSGPIHG
jgi:hypothetical protein